MRPLQQCMCQLAMGEKREQEKLSWYRPIDTLENEY